jgi:N-acetylglutamate synthase-like GNAT family acetyltransferase
MNMNSHKYLCPLVFIRELKIRLLMSPALRPATQADEKKIKDLIYQARLNPMSLEWERFIVAEEDGQFVGCVQLKPHKDGARELASLAVIPEKKGRGIGAMLVNAIIEQNPGELYLMCEAGLTGYYQRFGFEEIGPEVMPRSFKVPYRAARLFSKVSGFRLAIMRRG